MQNIMIAIFVIFVCLQNKEIIFYAKEIRVAVEDGWKDVSKKTMK